MRIDVSNDSFDRCRDYSRVLLQQGRPILDRDWNEQTAIILEQFRSGIRAIYGRHGGPAGGVCGFVPYVDNMQLFLSRGDYSVDGLFLNCDNNYEYVQQKYYSQDELESGKIYFIYLEAIEREVTAGEEKVLLDPALPGIDLAARGQVVWRALHEDWTQIIANYDAAEFCKKTRGLANEWLKEKHAEQVVPPNSYPQPEALEEKARKNTNRLLRVECNNVSESTSVWKLSSSNAFALFKVHNSSSDARKQSAVADSREIKISLGSIGAWTPASGEYVELLTEYQVRFNEPGILFQVSETKKIFGQTIDSIDQVVVSLRNDRPLPDRISFLRVWDDVVTLDGLKGVKAGDYWQLAVRDTESIINEIKRLKLRRTVRHYAPLALFKVESNGSKFTLLDRFQRIVELPWRDVDDKFDLSVFNRLDRSGVNRSYSGS